MSDDYFNLLEAAYARALEGVATGASRRETREWIARMYPNIHAEDLGVALDDAIGDAAHVGIEKDDIHPSWLLGFGRSEHA